MMSEVKAAHGSQPMRECINPDKVMESIALLIAEVERLRAEQRLDLADVDRFRAMARGYMDERDDARLALAMERGEGWPEGWIRVGFKWRRIDGSAEIVPWVKSKHEDVTGYTIGRPTDQRFNRIQTCDAQNHEWWMVDGDFYPDALSALRAYQAKVTP